jgi:hypothetical protein
MCHKDKGNATIAVSLTRHPSMFLAGIQCLSFDQMYATAQWDVHA